MRNAVVALVVVIIAVLVWWQWPRHRDAKPGVEAQRAAATAPASASSSTPSKVRRLDPDQRKLLGQQIETAIKRSSTAAAATAAAAAHPGSAAPTLDGDPIIPLESVGKPLQEGLQASIPLLAACYEKSGTPPKTAAAMMTMASDPDLGTVIDTAAMTDASGQPLSRELDECLRDVVDSLALPPLGQPGKLQIQYTFKFD